VKLGAQPKDPGAPDVGGKVSVDAAGFERIVQVATIESPSGSVVVLGKVKVFLTGQSFTVVGPTEIVGGRLSVHRLAVQRFPPQHWESSEQTSARSRQ
jgi:hypothetical protein